MNENEFDLDFDFEKEYGMDPPKETPAPAQSDDDFDLSAILGPDFAEDASLFNSEYATDFDYGPDNGEYDQPEAPEAAPQSKDTAAAGSYNFQQSEESAVAGNFDFQQPETYQASNPQNSLAEEAAPSVPTRRRPMSKSRRFKNETLPWIIAGVAGLLILVFIIGSVSRAIGGHIKDKENSLNASEAAITEAQRLEKEAQTLLAEAANLAAGYDYDGAIAKLEGFTGDPAKFVEVSNRLSEYKQAKSQLIAHNDPGAVPNLSFHVLIADPSRAFVAKEFGGLYNRNFVTVDEFQKILDQLYTNGYVLVDMDSFIAETDTGGTVTYSAKPLYLPDGKKPVMITETLVNYFNYMIDSNDDGVADKDGGGFATRLVVQNGEVKAEMVDSAGETVVGDYDLVPILNNFIEAHPDFSYQGSRATLAVTGYEGIFGYRTNKSVIDTKGQAYYDEQVAGAKKVVEALLADGYKIASFTYNNEDYGELNASSIQADLAKFTEEVVPITGPVDTLVYARSSDISSTGDYTGSKYNVLQEAGFRYFISNGNKPSAKVTNEYVRQLRLMVTGSNLAHAPSMYSNYFDAKTVLNSQRGNVPN